MSYFERVARVAEGVSEETIDAIIDELGSEIEECLAQFYAITDEEREQNNTDENPNLSDPLNQAQCMVYPSQTDPNRYNALEYLREHAANNDTAIRSQLWVALGIYGQQIKDAWAHLRIKDPDHITHD